MITDPNDGLHAFFQIFSRKIFWGKLETSMEFERLKKWEGKGAFSAGISRMPFKNC